MSKKFKLSIQTPKGIFYHGEIEMLTIKLTDGFMGLMADHVSIISSIKTCAFKIYLNAHTVQEGVISGGLLEMKNNEATVLTVRVNWENSINLLSSKKILSELKQQQEKNTKISRTEEKILNSKIIYYEESIKLKESI